MRTDLDHRIAELAREQHGVMTRSQLLSAGGTSKKVRSRLASGRLVRLHRGVYLLGALDGPLEPVRAREMAAVLACGPAAVVSHTSAGRLWGLLPGSEPAGGGRPTASDPSFGGRPTASEPSFHGGPESRGRSREWDTPPPAARPSGGATVTTDPVDVTMPSDVRRRRQGIRCHRSGDLEAGDVEVVDRIPVTAPLRTLRDLSTVLSPRALNRAAARAERRGLVTTDGLDRLATRFAGRAGAPVLRAAFGAGRGPVLTRSEAEERLLDLIRSARLPRPEVNVAVGQYEVDFLWKAEGLVVEVDGFRYHASRWSFEADRRRDAALTARGLAVCRVTWRQLTDERDATLARLAGLLASRRRGE